MRDETGDSIPPAPSTIQLRVFNPTHGTTGFVFVVVLSSGTGVLSSAANRNARDKLCPNRQRKPGRKSAPCSCSLKIEGGRVRPGDNGAMFIDPGYRWTLSIPGERELRKGSAFSAGEALSRAKVEARSVTNPGSINVVQLTYDQQNPGRMPLLRIIYLGEWNAEDERWEETIHPGRELRPEECNPGHGEDSEPLEFPGPFSFDDTDEPPPRVG